jgi:hypothetical protein
VAAQVVASRAVLSSTDLVSYLAIGVRTQSSLLYQNEETSA